MELFFYFLLPLAIVADLIRKWRQRHMTPEQREIDDLKRDARMLKRHERRRARGLI